MIAQYLSLLTVAASVVASRRAPGPTNPTKPDLTYLFTVNITTSAHLPIGTTPFGERQFEPITGGTFSGPRLQGKTPKAHHRAGAVRGKEKPKKTTTKGQEDAGSGLTLSLLTRHRQRRPRGRRLGHCGRQRGLQPRRRLCPPASRRRQHRGPAERARPERLLPLRDRERRVRLAEPGRRVWGGHQREWEWSGVEPLAGECLAVFIHKACDESPVYGMLCLIVLSGLTAGST